MNLTKLTETASTITLGWTPPPGVGGYVFYANGQVVSVATANLKDGSPRNTAKYSKTAPGPPFRVAAVCLQSGILLLDTGTYSETAPPPPPPPPPSDGTVYTPTGLDNTGTNDMTSAIQAFLNSVPSGTASNPSIARFPSGTYRIHTAITIANKNYLTIESASAVLGGNVTFNWTTPMTLSGGFWSGNDSLRCLTFRDCSNLTLRYLYVHGPSPMPANGSDSSYGAYPNDGFKAWSEVSVTGGPRDTEHMHGVMVIRCPNLLMDRVKIDDCPGDGIYAGSESSGAKETWTGGLITGCDIRACHRQAISLVGTYGLTMRNNTIKRIGFQCIDLEPNNAASSNYFTTVDANTWLSWDGLLQRSSVMAFAGSKQTPNYCEDLVITNNVSTGRQFLIRLNSMLGGLSSYPSPNRIKRVTITNNVSDTNGSQQEINQVDTLRIAGNTLPVASGAPFKLDLCTDVTYA